MMRYCVLPLVALAFCSGFSGALAAQANPSAQSAAPAAPSADALNIPNDTVIVAKLLTTLDAHDCKPGDAVEVQTTDDIKLGRQVLLKKGSTLSGHVTAVQPRSTEQPESMVAILFDKAKTKNGQESTLYAVIQALAPPPNKIDDTLDAGRGLAQATQDATVVGDANAETGNVPELTAKSTGTYGLPGVKVAFQNNKGIRLAVVTASKGEIRLKKGMQVVMLILNP